MQRNLLIWLSFSLLSFLSAVPAVGMPLRCGQIVLSTGEIVNPLGPGEPLVLATAVDDLRSALLSEFDVEPSGNSSGIVWSGPLLGRQRESLKSAGNDPLITILTTFVQLGREQGQRYTLHSQEWRDIGEKIIEIELLVERQDAQSIRQRLMEIRESLGNLKSGAGTVPADITRPPVIRRLRPSWPADNVPMDLIEIVGPAAQVIASVYRVRALGKEGRTLDDFLADQLPKYLADGRLRALQKIGTFERDVGIFIGQTRPPVLNPPEEHADLQTLYDNLVTSFHEATDNLLSPSLSK